MSKSGFIPFVLSLLTLSMFADEGLSNFTLASGGKTTFRIVLPEDAIPAEKTAVRELQQHLKAITDAEFPLVSLSEAQGGPVIAVGFNPLLPEKLSAEHYPNLGSEEFVIDAAENTLLLAGGRPRGALYAVYEFLERLGVRWFTPTETYMPKRQDLTLEVIPERYASPFRSRTNVIGNNPTKEWSARNRMNSFIEWSNPGEEYGNGVLQGPDMDNMYRYLDVGIFKSHPEWAAFVDGKRQTEHTTNNWGTCLSNVQLRKFVVALVMDWLRAHPGYTDVWLTSNDGSPYCRCPECQALYDAHGGAPSAAQMILVNELAEQVAKEFPAVRVKTLAYSWSQEPPTNITMADNVTVMLCAQYDFFSEIGVDEDAKKFEGRVERWKKIVSELETYLYSHPYDDFWFPAPCLYNQARNIRHIKDLGFKLIHQEDFGKMGLVGGEQCALRSWLFTRMAWRPDSDVEELIQDFCEKYYGDAAEDVLFAIHRTEQKRASGWRPASGLTKGVPNYVDRESIAPILDRLKPRYERESDPVIKKRLGYILLPYLWAEYWMGIEGYGQIQRDKGIWGALVKDRATLEASGQLIKQLMIENGINALQESGQFNPRSLKLVELARAYSYVTLKDGGTQAVIVPGLMGKMVEFTRNGHNVIKYMWGHIKSQYPEYGYGRDFFNGELPHAFEVETRTENSLSMKACVANGTAFKRMALNGGTLDYTLSVTASKDGQWTFGHQPLLDLNADELGIYPDVYIQVSDGWRFYPMGRKGTFWYQDGPFDLSDFTGRIILVAESKAFALELAMEPEKVDSLCYMYDRYNCPPEGSGHILELMLKSATAELKAGQTMDFTIQYRILLPGEFPADLAN